MRAGGSLACPGHPEDLVRLPVSIIDPVRLARRASPAAHRCHLLGVEPAIAQTVPSAIPYGQTAALPPGAASAPQVDPNAPHWVQLEGYNGDGSVSEHWELVRPQDYDVTNYRGFHTATD